ncbi:MAG: glycosyltransferase [Flavobacteriia bacterium]|nr:glycosyltransferase [Flavobacteriia bacterium]
MNSIKITILTPSFNQGDFIEKNILSVLNQQYENFEHIIIDGGSTDSTIEMLKKYPHLKWISEKDNGQADALNKGFSMATGDVIGWVNSDDYLEENIFSFIAKEFKSTETQWIVGYLNEVNLSNLSITKIESPIITYDALIQNPDIVKQPCTFFRRELIEHAGKWNDQFYMIMDYDLWLRISKITSPKMVNYCFANFVIHPNQKTNPQNIKKQMSEIQFVLKREKVSRSYINKILFKKYKSFYKKKIKKLFRK